MKILLIEDEAPSLRQTEAAIRQVSETVEIVVAGCRDDAVEAIEQDSFDLIICDLRIPPTNTSADIDEAHGLAVHGRARELSPGTPLVFLTAFATPRNTKNQLSGGGLEIVFGIVNFKLVQLIEKDDVDGLEEYLQALFGASDAIDMSCSITDSELDDAMFNRAVRVYASITGHTRALIEKSSGLSGASVGRVRLESDVQAPATVLMKVLSYEDATDETERFGKFVANRLQPGYFAPSLSPLRAGLQKKSALIYTLADDRYKSLFDILRDTPDRAAQIVRKLREALHPWMVNGTQASVTIGELRRSRISDEKLKVAGFDLSEFAELERRSIFLKSVIAHGDLHGENILVDTDERPMLIDYGDVGIAYAPFDPVTLELSAIYHEDGPARSPDFRSGVQWDRWLDVEACYGGTTFASFARECRSWAYAEDSQEACAAFAYAYSLRQLKYPDAVPEIALTIGRASASLL